MFTTLKNPSVTKWTWSGTGFVRESPGEKQLAVPNRRQVYKRARYYDPTTGEFISRDPLEYVDGMSQYRGYFALGGVDPYGWYTQDVNCGGTKIGTLKFPKYATYEKGAVKGLTISGGFKLDRGKSFKDSPCCCDEIQFVQVVKSNYPIGEGKVTEGFSEIIVDNGGATFDDLGPFYPANPNDNGYDLSFFDRPRRRWNHKDPKLNWPENIDSIVWTAELALACVKREGKGGTVDFLAFIR